MHTKSALDGVDGCFEDLLASFPRLRRILCEKESLLNVVAIHLVNQYYTNIEFWVSSLPSSTPYRNGGRLWHMQLLWKREFEALRPT